MVKLKDSHQHIVPAKVYPNAPITEAIIDIRLKFNKDPELELFRSLKSIVEDEYPIERKRMGIQGMMTFKSGHDPVSTSSSKPVGLMYLNKASNRLFQANLDGFSFNMLNPYSNWDEFSKEAFRIWRIYSGLIDKTFIIERLGLRYINRIGLPLPIKTFEKYITYVPPIPQNLPKILNRFFMQVDIPVENGHVTITETMEQVDKEKSQLPFLLDIDCIRPVDSLLDENELIKYFAELRNIKNMIFEGCITNEARKLFN